MSNKIIAGPMADITSVEESGPSVITKVGVPFRKLGKLTKGLAVVSKDATIARVEHARNVHAGKKVVKAGLATVGAQVRHQQEEQS